MRIVSGIGTALTIVTSLAFIVFVALNLSEIREHLEPGDPWSKQDVGLLLATQAYDETILVFLMDNTLDDQECGTIVEMLDALADIQTEYENRWLDLESIERRQANLEWLCP